MKVLRRPGDAFVGAVERLASRAESDPRGHRRSHRERSRRAMDTTTYTAPELTEVGEFGTDTLGGFGDVYDFAGFYN
ncbi:hypothetical protein GCM10023222_49100 [Saccharopolyspora cebuensis]